MDHARKIGKTEVPFPWSKRPSPPSSISDKPLLVDEELTEDRRFVNWRKWLHNREQHYRHYEMYTNRDRHDLLIINDVDDFRRKIEMRNLMECAGDSVPSKTGKYRGNPAFWVTPECLSKHGNPNLPDISVTLTRKQLSIEPQIERVALPDLIKQEKGLPIVCKKTPLWQRSQYLKNRKKNLSREMKLLETKEPEISELVVKGEKLSGRRKKRLAKFSIITIKKTEPFTSDDDSQTAVLEHDDAAILMIQDCEIRINENVSLSQNNEKLLNDYSWSLIFDSLLISNIAQRKIRFENRGNCSIIYRWRYGTLGTSFVPPIPRSSPFYFNKNKGIILPQEIIELPVWFCSQVPCTITEFWTLTTEPRIIRGNLTFRFWGSAVLMTPENNSIDLKIISNRSMNPEYIEQYLNRRIRDAQIQEIIQSILEDVPDMNPPSVPYKSLFLESQIFRTKNHPYFYHSILIDQFKNMYDEATIENSPTWSLSLMDLRRVLLMLNNSDFRNEALNRFNESCRNSLRSNLYLPMEYDKLFMVYNLMCSFANKFEIESDHVASKCFQREIPNGKTSSEAPGNISTTTSISRISQSSSTPRRNTKKTTVRSVTTSKTNILTSTNREIFKDLSAKKAVTKCLLYKEVFHVRIREMLVNAIGEICAVVDSINNLNPRDK